MKDEFSWIALWGALWGVIGFFGFLMCLFGLMQLFVNYLEAKEAHQKAGITYQQGVVK